MKRLVLRAGLGVLGVTLTLAWWSFHGGSKSSESQEKIPNKVWAGGGGTLAIDVETSCAATMRINFEEHEKDITSRRNLNTWENIPAGSRSWTIDVPPGVGGYIELNADKPQVGDKLAWHIRVNGQIVDEQSQALEQALKSGEAFFLQVFYTDYSQAQKEEE